MSIGVDASTTGLKNVIFEQLFKGVNRLREMIPKLFLHHISSFFVISKAEAGEMLQFVRPCLLGEAYPPTSFSSKNFEQQAV